MKKVPFSKAIIAIVLFFCLAFFAWACWEMHVTGDLSALGVIAGEVAAALIAALGFYVWRAKKSDDYALALKKAKAEKKLGVKIETETTDITEEEALG